MYTSPHLAIGWDRVSHILPCLPWTPIIPIYQHPTASWNILITGNHRKSHCFIRAF
jgi:hypothetical protein